MRLTSTFATLAIFTASTSAAVINHRQVVSVTNGGVPDVITMSSTASVTNGGTLDTTIGLPTTTLVVPPPATTTIIDIFPTNQACADAEAQKGSYQGLVNDPVCSFLVDECVKTVAAQNTPLYNINSCVAAATCDSVSNLLQLATCAQSSLEGVTQSELPSLDFQIYADIVGDCAWIPESQGGACSITRQNYIDWFYNTLDKLNTPVWPDVNIVIDKFWMPIRSWTNTGETVPYLNFNDWLHWST